MADRRLQVFHAVARQLSFTKAAEQLFMTQPAVTFQIKQLEEHLNTRLFERNHGRIALTPAGELVMGYAEKILALSEELETRVGELTGAISGPLLLGASTTVAEFYLPQILGEFKAQYPHVQAHMTVGNSETIVTRVAEHALDLGLIESPSTQPGVATEVICEDVLMMICSPQHRLASAKKASVAEVAAEPFISREPGSGTREVADQYFQANRIAPDAVNVVMELGSPEAIKGVVETGLGVSILSRATVSKELRLGTLRALPLDPPLVRGLSVVTPDGRFRSRLLSTFIEFATSRMQAMAAAR
ncbi:MAG: LysR family transcriptional regulator [Betaproteobacteria bacterium]|jgi:DNA-binding transcriptional LysR family regulator|nr:LysR family transcriptional regulator [Betaproteobacteria bacterium]